MPFIPLFAVAAAAPSSNPLQRLQQIGNGVLSRLQGKDPQQQQEPAGDLHPPAVSNHAAGHGGSGAQLLSGLGAQQGPAGQLQPRHQAQSVFKIGPTSKDELGRATWTFLHVLAAQFPDNPSRSQQKDAKQLVDILTRIYPCADCAKHFKEVVRLNPPEAGSGTELRQWMCQAHNAVNSSIGKPAFNCKYVEARWGALDCGEQLACDMQGANEHKNLYNQ